MELKIIEHLLGKFKAIEDQYTIAMKAGVEDFGEYKKLCGVLHGIDLCRDELDILLKRLRDAEDEE